MIAEAHLVALPAHAGDDVARATPRIQGPVQQLQLWRAAQGRGSRERGEGARRLSSCGRALPALPSLFPPPMTSSDADAGGDGDSGTLLRARTEAREDRIGEIGQHLSHHATLKPGRALSVIDAARDRPHPRNRHFLSHRSSE